jgi:hypothetical protein
MAGGRIRAKAEAVVASSVASWLITDSSLNAQKKQILPRLGFPLSEIVDSGTGLIFGINAGVGFSSVP